jgi:hypothetical protein
MDTLNSNPTETVMVPVENLVDSATVPSTPEAVPAVTAVPAETAAPVAIAAPAAKAVPTATTPAPVPVVDLTSSVSGTGTPKASPSTGGPGAVAVKMELPKTTGQTVGGWNRFAGYNPNAAKNKPKDGRGGPGGRR